MLRRLVEVAKSGRTGNYNGKPGGSGRRERRSGYREANEPASHRNVDGYRRPWILANFRRFKNALPASRTGIEYLLEGKCGDGKRSGPPELSLAVRNNSRSCHFTSAFCDRAVSHRSCRPIARCSRVDHGVALPLLEYHI
ncbi:hypothetical protein EVAR_89739_1 [Eumeta japonica]|uniref:Uncharacterized protein n=1 Tax=Eumeta variegata TaxID=151549 RepID=A0A4C1Y672_EUMVA|nr:hypothetical protein EVAR_89739_1 [Eumeta japonica]